MRLVTIPSFDIGGDETDCQQGNQETHWYRTTVRFALLHRQLFKHKLDLELTVQTIICWQVAVIVPCDGTAQFLLDHVRFDLLDGCPDRDRFIEFFADRCSDPSARAAAFSCIRGFFNKIWARIEPPSFNAFLLRSMVPGSNALQRALDVALEMKVFDFLEEVATHIGKEVPIFIFARIRHCADMDPSIPSDSTMMNRYSPLPPCHFLRVPI